jgi:hypothetical protein
MLALVVLGAAVALAAAADKIQTRHPKGEDLAQMKDGETRTFGEGKAQVTASRRGDNIEVTLPSEDGKAPRTLTCKAGEHCYVMAHDDLGHGTVMVMRTAGAEDAPQEMTWVSNSDDGGTWTDESGNTMVFHSAGGEHEIQVVAEADGEPGTVKVIRVDAGDGEPVRVFTSAGGDAEAFTMLSEADAPHVIKIEVKGTMLHCPEGDATLHVEDGDEAVYLCPKHNVAMEGGPMKTFERRIEVHQKSPQKSPGQE